jgi:hypothetical protein
LLCNERRVLALSVLLPANEPDFLMKTHFRRHAKYRAALFGHYRTVRGSEPEIGHFSDSKIIHEQNIVRLDVTVQDRSGSNRVQIAQGRCRVYEPSDFMTDRDGNAGVF